MRVYKTKYKNKKGEYQEVKKFWIEVVDKREKAYRKVLRLATAIEGKKLAQKIGNKVEELIEYAVMNQPNSDLINWFAENVPKKLRERLSDICLLPKSHKEIDRPLLDYMADFTQDIFKAGKGKKTKKTTTGNGQARMTSARVRNIIKGCNFANWREVTADKVNEYIESRPDGMSQQTAHFYVQSFRRFSRWMVENGHAGQTPKINSVTVPENYGRPFELTEFEALLRAAKMGPERYGLTGYQRYVLYIVACETGLRRGELRSLKVKSIDFDKATIFVEGGNGGATKNQSPATQNFNLSTRQLLREYVRGKMPDVQLFPIHDKSAKMIQADCEDAGIEVENSEGKKLTFHSLRHTCGSYLLAQGAQPKEVMEIMRHKDYKLTMGRYGHLLNDKKQQAVNRLPNWTERIA